MAERRAESLTDHYTSSWYSNLNTLNRRDHRVVMLKLILDDEVYSVNELSEQTGIAPHTIRARLRKGYTVEEALRDMPIQVSVSEFNHSSWWVDWIGMSTTYLYKIYWDWCVSHGYTPVSQTAFIRQILSMYPNLKTVPTRTKDNSCCRIIRER